MQLHRPGWHRPRLHLVLPNPICPARRVGIGARCSRPPQTAMSRSLASRSPSQCSRLRAALPAGLGQLHVDAAPVEVAGAARYQAVPHQPVHQARQRALAEVHRVGEVLRTEHVLGAGFGLNVTALNPFTLVSGHLPGRP